jgi:hypothetical protein
VWLEIDLCIWVVTSDLVNNTVVPRCPLYETCCVSGETDMDSMPTVRDIDDGCACCFEVIDVRFWVLSVVNAVRLGSFHPLGLHIANE